MPRSFIVSAGNKGSSVEGEITSTDVDANTRALDVQIKGSSIPTGLTDAQLRAAAVPVSGTFYPATQSISGSVSVSNFPASQAVTGTFFPATQPVSVVSLPLPSGAATSSKQPSLGTAGVASSDVISIQGIASMTPVKTDGSGITQPVSGTVTANQGGTWTVQPGNTANTTAWKVDGSAVTQPVSGPLTDTQLRASAVPISGALTDAQLRASSVPVAATAPTLTKGTQGGTGYSVQDLKDAGRVALSFYALAAAAGATGTETAITLTKSSGTSATSTGTSFVITSGKRFRIVHLSVATRGHSTATIQTTTFNLRVNTAGAVTTGSTPIVFAARSATPATASAWDRYILPIPDGFEILGDGTLQFGLTAASTYVTNAPTWDVNILGFEY